MTITAEIVAVNRDKTRQYIVARFVCANPSDLLDWPGDVLWLPLDLLEDAGEVEAGDWIELAVVNTGKPAKRPADKPGKVIEHGRQPKWSWASGKPFRS